VDISEPTTINNTGFKGFWNPFYSLIFGFTIRFLVAVFLTDSEKISRVTTSLLCCLSCLICLSPPGIDSSLANNFGRGMINNLSVTTTLIAITVIGRWPFLVTMIILSFLYYNCKFVRLFFGSDFDESPQLLNITVRPPGTCGA
jgi:hypothetical protein